MSALKCTQCGHENDLTRVFCQNCGSRLEREEGAAGPTIAAPTQVPTERPATTRRKKDQSKQGGGRGLGFIISLLATVGMAAGFAALIQMSRKPDNIPAPKPANENQATTYYQKLKAFSDSSFPRAIDVFQDDANNYLACRLIASEASGSAAKAKFTRAFVVIEDKKLRFFVEEDFHGLPLYVYLEYQPEIVDNLVTLKETGGGIGRLRFNEQILPMLDRMVGPVAQSAVDATDLLKTLNGIDFKVDNKNPGKSAATLRWSGSSKPAAQ